MTDVEGRGGFVEFAIEEEMKCARIANAHRTLPLLCIADRVPPGVGNQEQR